MIKDFLFRLDVKKEINNRLYNVNSNDLHSVKFTFVVTDNGIPLDLAGLTVRVAIRKPDKKAVWQDCTVTNAPKGEVEVILESQAYIKKGEHEAELMLYKGTDTVAITQKFHYRAAEGIMSDKSLKSETVLGPIDQKLAEVEGTLEDLRKNGTGIDAQARQDIQSVTTQLAEKANQTYVARVLQNAVSGAPKPIDTFEELQNTYPNGEEGIFLVLEDGHIYVWNGSTWQDAGVYQATKDDSVDVLKQEIDLNFKSYTIINGIENSDFREGLTPNFGSGATLEIVNGKLRTTKKLADDITNLGIYPNLRYKAHKYYFSMKVTPLTPGNISLILFPNPGFAWSDTLATITNPNVNQEYTLNWYGNLGETEDQTMLFHVRGHYAANNLGSFDVGELMAFNLTEIYGAGNEPTQEEFEKILEKYGDFIVGNVTDYVKTSPTKIEKMEQKIIQMEQTTHSKPLAGKTIVLFGDSLQGNYEAPESIGHFISEKTGANVINVGFGGCRMGGHYGFWDAFSMYRLAEAIVTGDFSLQKRALIDGNAESVPINERLPAYFKLHLERLMNIDFTKVWMILIAYGTNDFMNDDLGLDDPDNPYEVWTYKGATRYSIEKIAGEYPTINIMLLTPIYRTFSETENSDNYIRRGYKLTDFVQGLKDVANEYHYPYFDGYHKLGFNKLNQSSFYYDGTHLYPIGNKRYGEAVGSDLINGY